MKLEVQSRNIGKHDIIQIMRKELLLPTLIVILCFSGLIKIASEEQSPSQFVNEVVPNVFVPLIQDEITSIPIYTIWDSLVK